MAAVTETIQVSGVRCERCVHRLAAALQGHDGLDFANANLMGQVTLTWDDERTHRDGLVAALATAVFHEAQRWGPRRTSYVTTLVPSMRLPRSGPDSEGNGSGRPW